MIIFEFDYETHDSDGQLRQRPVYWLSTTEVSAEDRTHEDEIYEQLNAEVVFS